MEIPNIHFGRGHLTSSHGRTQLATSETNICAPAATTSRNDHTLGSLRLRFTLELQAVVVVDLLYGLDGAVPEKTLLLLLCPNDTRIYVPKVEVDLDAHELTAVRG